MLPEIGVLVVDDQDAFRRVARAVIERAEGFALVAEAADAAGALTAVVALPGPAMVLMDVGLGGGVDGIAATRDLLDRRPGLVVVLLSSRDPADLPAAARTCGAAACVAKFRLSPRLLRVLWDGRGQSG
jgi:DNA-binding NarL/FixJ family response regulator